MDALTAVRDKWFNLYSTDKLILSFKGVGIKNNRLLYLRPTQQEPRLKHLHKLLQEELSERGIESATRFLPHVAIAETKSYKNGYFGNSIKKTLNEVEILNIEPTSISVLSLSPTAKKVFDHSLLTLPLQKECPTNENEPHDQAAAYPPDEKEEQHQDTNQL